MIKGIHPHKKQTFVINKEGSSYIAITTIENSYICQDFNYLNSWLYRYKKPNANMGKQESFLSHDHVEGT